MTLRLMVDAEELVVAYLKTVEELIDLVGQRIYSEIPKPATWPQVRVERIGGTPGAIPAHLDQARIQVSAWADKSEELGGKAQARLIARTAEAAMYDMVNASFEEAVVTDVEGVQSPTYDPDGKSGRPRYRFDVIVRLHPTPTS